MDEKKKRLEIRLMNNNLAFFNNNRSLFKSKMKSMSPRVKSAFKMEFKDKTPNRSPKAKQNIVNINLCPIKPSGISGNNNKKSLNPNGLLNVKVDVNLNNSNNSKPSNNNTGKNMKLIIVNKKNQLNRKNSKSHKNISTGNNNKIDQIVKMDRKNSQHILDSKYIVKKLFANNNNNGNNTLINNNKAELQNFEKKSKKQFDINNNTTTKQPKRLAISLNINEPIENNSKQANNIDKGLQELTLKEELLVVSKAEINLIDTNKQHKIDTLIEDMLESKIVKSYYYCENQNQVHRNEMEDYHSTLIGLAENIDAYCIFDGHGGNSVALLAKENIKRIFSENYNEFGSNCNISDLIKKVYSQLDAFILSTINNGDVGSTLTLLLLEKQDSHIKLYCSNVGDSSCFIIENNSQITKLTYDHKCCDEFEAARVKQSDGIIFNNRVFGSLMLTRAIGDKNLKEYGVISEPFICEYMLNIDSNSKSRVVLGSDGIWDVIDNEKLSCFSQENKEAKKLAIELVDSSMQLGSRDNISCYVIDLN